MTPGPCDLTPPPVEETAGVRWCRDWTQQVDRCVLAAAAALEVDRGLAVVGLGSYARRQLCPASDVDLLLLHSGWSRRDLAELVRRLCYPLWDAGLTVGYAVRSPAEAVRAAGDRLETATALADRRLVLGDRGLLDDLASRADRWLWRNSFSLLAQMEEDAGRRHAASGDRPGLLEPHLKDARGGLRDLQMLRWAAACLFGDPGLDPLVGARYLSVAERRDLTLAAERLLAVRCALHASQPASARKGRRVDVLYLDLQDAVAQRLGLPDGNDLLRQVGLAARAVSYVRERVWPQLLEDARRGRGTALWWRRRSEVPTPVDDGLQLRGRTIEVAADRTAAQDPGLALHAVAAAARRGARLQRADAERLRREVADAAPLPWDDRARRNFLELLRAGRAAAGALADADYMRLLVAYLPDWERVRGRPQRNPFHRYDLDTHLLQTVAELGNDVDAVDDPDVLLLAAFLHDVGKAWPGDHSVVGARLARAWVGQMGFSPARAERVALLVRHHLLLPDVATRRDLDDERELRAVAALVGDAATLDMLHLLSLADARATGPAAHSPWKDGLIGLLHRRVRRLLSGADVPAVPSAEAVAAAVRRIAPDDPAVEKLLAEAEDAYLAAAGAEQVLAHARLLHPGPTGAQLRVGMRPTDGSDASVLSIVGLDRRGLMADCAGILAAHGLEVLEARAFTSAGGLALDWFVVTGDQPSLRSVAEDFEAAGAGSLDIAAAVRDRESRRDALPPRLAAPLPITVDIDDTGTRTRIEVRAPDIQGLLYRLASVLAAAGLDVVGARVTTLGPEVRDVFFLQPAPLPNDLVARLRDAARRPAGAGRR